MDPLTFAILLMLLAALESMYYLTEGLCNLLYSRADVREVLVEVLE